MRNPSFFNQNVLSHNSPVRFFSWFGKDFDRPVLLQSDRRLKRTLLDQPPGRPVWMLWGTKTSIVFFQLNECLLNAGCGDGSNPEQGSSSKRTSGSKAKTRAMQEALLLPTREPRLKYGRRSLTSSQSTADFNDFSNNFIQTFFSLPLNLGP